jgi:hypothetical protein
MDSGGPAVAKNGFCRCRKGVKDSKGGRKRTGEFDRGIALEQARIMVGGEQCQLRL